VLQRCNNSLLLGFNSVNAAPGDHQFRSHHEKKKKKNFIFSSPPPPLVLSTLLYENFVTINITKFTHLLQQKFNIAFVKEKSKRQHKNSSLSRHNKRSDFDGSRCWNYIQLYTYAYCCLTVNSHQLNRREVEICYYLTKAKKGVDNVCPGQHLGCAVQPLMY
jgi:hypothetical protein